MLWNTPIADLAVEDSKTVGTYLRQLTSLNLQDNALEYKIEEWKMDPTMNTLTVRELISSLQVGVGHMPESTTLEG